MQNCERHEVRSAYQTQCDSDHWFKSATASCIDHAGRSKAPFTEKWACQHSRHSVEADRGEGQLRAVGPGTSQTKCVRLSTNKSSKGSGRVGNSVLGNLCHNGHGASSMPPTLSTQTESSKTVIASLFPDLLPGCLVYWPPPTLPGGGCW